MDINTFEKSKGQISVVNNFFIPHVDLSIGHYGYEKTTSEKEYTTSEGYPTYRMHYIIDGVLTLHVNGKKYRLRKNHCFYLRPDVSIGYQPDSKNPATYYWVSFTGTNVFHYLQKMGFKENVYFLSIPTKQQKKLHRAFFANFQLDESVENLKDVIFSENFLRIVRLISLSSDSAQVKKKTKPKKKYVERAMEIINNRYMDPTFSIRDVASDLFLHENYFSKLFKMENKLSFSAYLSRFRVEMSITLMDQGYTSVSALAAAVGFSDPLYFSKVFKKYNLCSPSEQIRRVAIKKKTAPQNPPIPET